jgi:prepilin-type N-terminal cleavage/methylation domain-containing protein
VHTAFVVGDMFPSDLVQLRSPLNTIPVKKATSSFWPTSSRGFTLVELMIVVAISAVLMAVSLLEIVPALRNAKINAGYQTVYGQMRTARQLAIDGRQVTRLTFQTPRTLLVEAQNPPASNGSISYSVLSSIDLPAELKFDLETGAPNSKSTLPDGMGSGSLSIDFNGKNQLYFQPDGSALDNTKQLASGVVYIAKPGRLDSSRAVTLYGATGRMKGWRLAVTPSVTWKPL